MEIPELIRNDTDILHVENFQASLLTDVECETTSNGSIKLRVQSQFPSSLNAMDEFTSGNGQNVEGHDARIKKVKTVNDFELHKVLGRGAYGKVYLVSTKRKEFLAMKTMRKSEIVERNVITNIHNERDVLGSVDHPFLVKQRYAFQTKHKLYLLMNYVGGGEMFTRLEREGGFIERDAKFYAAEIALALNYLHSCDIIYRDLKPENVLFSTDGHIALTDFGFAKQYGANAEESKSFCGSLQYLAPEVVKRSGHGKAADWWTLGILIFEMLTTRTPFSGSDRSKIEEAILTKKLVFPKSFSPPLVHLLKGLLTRESSERLTFEQIKHHSFFMGINWVDLEAKKITPPFIPVVTSVIDVSNFDERFTAEPVIDSPVDRPQQGSTCINHEAFQLNNTDNNTNIPTVQDVILSTDVPVEGAIVITNSLELNSIIPCEGAGGVRGGDAIAENQPVELTKHQKRAMEALYTEDNQDDRNLFKGFDYTGNSPFMSATNTPLMGSDTNNILKPPILLSTTSGDDDDDDDVMHFSLKFDTLILNDSTTDHNTSTQDRNINMNHDTSSSSSNNNTNTNTNNNAILDVSSSIVPNANNTIMNILNNTDHHSNLNDTNTQNSTSDAMLPILPLETQSSNLSDTNYDQHSSRQGLYHHNSNHTKHAYDYASLKKAQVASNTNNNNRNTKFNSNAFEFKPSAATFVPKTNNNNNNNNDNNSSRRNPNAHHTNRHTHSNSIDVVATNTNKIPSHSYHKNTHTTSARNIHTNIHTTSHANTNTPTPWTGWKKQ